MNDVKANVTPCLGMVAIAPPFLRAMVVTSGRFLIVPIRGSGR